MPTPHTRRARATTAVAVLIAIAAAAGWLGWHRTSASTRPAARAAVVRIAGVVDTQGGPLVASGGSDLHPIRSAPVLVTGVTLSGRRWQRRLNADRRGRFTLSLPPGTYRLSAVLYPGSIPLAQEPHTRVRVRIGQTTRPLPIRIIEPVF